MTTLTPVADAAVDPVAARAVEEAAELLRRRSATRSIEVDPPWRGPGARRAVRRRLLGPMICAADRATRRADRGPRADAEDMEPLSSWRSTEAAQGHRRAARARRADRSCRRFARAIVEWTAQYDALLTPALAERAAAARDDRHRARDDPMATLHALRARSRPFTPVCNVTGSAGDLAAAATTARTACPLGVQIIGQPGGRGRAARAGRAARGGAAVGRAARAGRASRPERRGRASSAGAEHRRHRAAARRRALRRRRCRAAWSSRPPSARPRPRWRARATPAAPRRRAATRRTTASGRGRAGRCRPRGAQHERARSPRG